MKNYLDTIMGLGVMDGNATKHYKAIEHIIYNYWIDDIEELFDTLVSPLAKYYREALIDTANDTLANYEDILELETDISRYGKVNVATHRAICKYLNHVNDVNIPGMIEEFYVNNSEFDEMIYISSYSIALLHINTVDDLTTILETIDINRCGCEDWGKILSKINFEELEDNLDDEDQMTLAATIKELSTDEYKDMEDVNIDDIIDKLNTIYDNVYNVEKVVDEVVTNNLPDKKKIKKIK